MTSTTLPQTVRTQAFIDGQFVDALDRATFESLAPATGGVIAEVAACGEADVDRAVRSARAAFNRGDWSRIAPADRKSVLLAFAGLIDDLDHSALTARGGTRSPQSSQSTRPGRLSMAMAATRSASAKPPRP
jgi:hypothetical protein